MPAGPQDGGSERTLLGFSRRTTRGGCAPSCRRLYMERGAAREAAAGQQTQSGSTSLETTRAQKAASSAQGLEFLRYFTLPGVDPFDEVEWEVRKALIGNEKGKVVFE